MLDRSATQPDVDVEPADTIKAKGEGAWGRLPYSVIRDLRLGPKGLAVLAIKATHTPDFVLNVGAVLKAKLLRECGRDVIERGLFECREASLLKRWQPPGEPGTFGRVVEHLKLPAHDEKSSIIVHRSWLDGKLSAKEFAAYLYVLAGTGNGAGVFANELAERFGWDKRTARKILKSLTTKHEKLKTDEAPRRNAAGHLCGGMAYHPAGWEHRPKCKSQGTVPKYKSQGTVNEPKDIHQGSVIQGTVFQGTTNPSGTPLHEPLREPTPLTVATLPKVYAAVAAKTSDEVVASLKDGPTNVEDEARNDRRLLKLIPIKTSADALEQVYMTFLGSDDALASLVICYTGGKVADELLRPAACFAWRTLIAALISDTRDAEQAADVLFAALNTRIAEKPEAFLRSMVLIANRVAADRYISDELYVGQKPGSISDRIQRKLAALQKHAAIDALNPKMFSTHDRKYLRRLVERHGVDETFAVVESVLYRVLFDGPERVGRIKTWTYFSAALAEEARLTQMAADGVRPGDVLCAHRHAEGDSQ